MTIKKFVILTQVPNVTFTLYLSSKYLAQNFDRNQINYYN